MLVLSRRAGESFLIGDNVEVVILGFDSRFVKVGIRAPKCVPILRKELQVVAEHNTTALDLPGPDTLHHSLAQLERVLQVEASPQPER